MLVVKYYQKLRCKYSGETLEQGSSTMKNMFIYLIHVAARAMCSCYETPIPYTFNVSIEETHHIVSNARNIM